MIKIYPKIKHNDTEEDCKIAAGPTPHIFLN